MRPYPIAPLSDSSDTKNPGRGRKLSEKESSRNWACLVWKFLVELVRVFCTYLGAPNCHIVKKPKNPKFYDFYIFFCIRPIYVLFSRFGAIR